MALRIRWIVTTFLLLLTGLPTRGLEAPKTLGISLEKESLRETVAERSRLEETLQKKIKDKLSETSLQPAAGETLDQYRRRLQGELATIFDQVITPIAQENMAQIDVNTPLAIAGKTTASSPPEGFPERVRESIADFLPLLGLSMDAVSTSDDRKSVSFKINPFKFEHGALSLSTSATEPEVFKPLADKIIEPLRDQEKQKLLGKAQDLDDVTFALAFGYTRRGVTWDASRHLYGRDFSLYQEIVDDFSKGTWDSVKNEMKNLSQQQSQFRTERLKPLADLMAGRRANVWDTPFSEIREMIKARQLPYSEAELIQGIVEEALNLGVLGQALARPDFDALPSLIDNQPQLVFTVARRTANEIVGPEGTTLTARYEMGSQNLNTVLREYRRLKARGTLDDSQAQLQAYKNVVSGDRGDYRSEDKLIFSLSYKWIDSYSFQHVYDQILLDPGTGDPEPGPIHRTAEVKLPKSQEWRGNLTFTRFLLTGSDRDNKTGVQLPRLTITVEAVQLRDDPDRQNRIIGKISYVQPATSGISIPISLTWANRSEFLGEQDRTLGAHLGLTYKLGTRK